MFLKQIDFNNSNYLPNILLMFGEEDFLLERAYDKLISNLVKTEFDKYNFEVIDPDDRKLEDLIDLASSYPMMSERRIIVAKRFEKYFTGRAKKNDKNPFEIYLNNPSKTTTLIIIANLEAAKDISKYADKGMSNTTFQKKFKSLKFPFNTLIENFDWIEFTKVSEIDYPKWIVNQFNEKNKTITLDAANIIAVQTRQTLRDLNNEINKIDTYYINKEQIDIDDIHFLIGSTREYNVFELQNAIGEKNKSKSIEILHKILSIDSQEILILTILTKFFITILKLKEIVKIESNPFQISIKAGIYTTHLDSYMKAANNYNLSQIDNAILKITETDFKLKSSSNDKLSLMQNLVLSIIN